MFERLFQAGAIGTMALKNRIFMAPMVRNWGTEDGCATARYVNHIERVARGGVGAITLEASYVDPTGKGFFNQLGLHDDHVIDDLRAMVEAAHCHGAKIGPQLFHAGRQTVARVMGSQPLAPSAIPCPLEQEMPKALTVEEIKNLATKFGDAARRAKVAGCDYVEIHGAHGYLVAEFLSGFSNKRTDDYGGSLENRMRFLDEVYAAVRAEVGPDFPVILRISGEELCPEGLTIDQVTTICKTFEAKGMNAFHITAGCYGSYATGCMISPMEWPDAPLAGLAERVRAEVKIPVIAVNKIRTPELAERLLAYGVADFIALGRPLLADPDWPVKAQRGDFAGINLCIACQEGCIQRLFGHQDVWCLTNPEAGREAEFAASPTEGAPRSVMVVGGGPGGMSAAIMAKRAGHQVSLYETADQLGGQLFDAAAAPHRPGWAELRRDLAYRVRTSGVDVHTSSRVTTAMIAEARPDVVILATGSKTKAAAWPVAKDTQVVSDRDLLEGRIEVAGKVVVAGGGCAGAQTAEFLAENGCEVTIVDLKDVIAGDDPLEVRALLLKRLERLGVRMLTRTRIVETKRGEVIAEGPNGRLSLPADVLVLAHGSEIADGLASDARNSVQLVISIGDCREPRRVIDAVLEGARAGWELRQPV
jgi:2,4-dienoyl-CoA reductase-like NADH-dependent reductase (Old Yellow Enzyme family)/thioredoxin reductase